MVDQRNKLDFFFRFLILSYAIVFQKKSFVTVADRKVDFSNLAFC